MAFSTRTKSAAVLAVVGGMTIKDAAKKYGANPNSVSAWVRASKETPKAATVTRGNRTRRQALVARQTTISPLVAENAKLRHLFINAMIELVSVQNRLQ